jgi:hypothetical protein
MYQRYALALLFCQWGAGNSSRCKDEFWLTNLYKCDWFSGLDFDPCSSYGQLEVLCLGNKGMLSTVRKIDLSCNQFNGTIPASRLGSPELEALFCM